ncbi:MAG: hypothetical protein CMC81_05590 [Flavobacteriaceae bacterium]|nr:hypothetical protein [Flavobacteriaceae bacterium]|tara:strand:- start:1799 stop:3073 length:1275 start_codon:yes stop_codon:yes gene_type:complete
MKYLFLFFFTYLSVFSQNIKERKIKRIINESPILRYSHVSFSLQPLGKKYKKIKGFNTAKYMTPASNNKLLTFLATIQTFDSIPILNYKKTNDTLHLEPTGYPLLFHPKYPDRDMEKFLKSKKNVVLHWDNDNVIKYGRGWAWDDYKYSFSAEKSIFPIYGNLVKFYKNKNDQVISTPKLFENIEDFSIKNKVERKKGSNIFYINPNTISNKDTLFFPFITSKNLTLKILNKNLNSNFSISHNENIKFTRFNLKNNEKIFRALLWESDNLVAESLLLMSGNKLNNEFSTLKAINEFQKKWTSWLPDQVLWFDGSGLSRYNMITSRSIVSVLQRIKSKIGFIKIKSYFATFGDSGGLSENYRKSKGLVMYAKTGNIKNNSNLSGYLMSKSGNWYCFSLMINHYESPLYVLQSEMGKILDYVFLKG